jgi:hypothetical protein
MAFLRLATIFKYLEASADSRCVVEGEGVLLGKLLLLCGVTKIVDNRYSVAGLCLQTSALKSAPHKINGELQLTGCEVEIHRFTCTCKAGLSGTCKHISACLFYCVRLYKICFIWHIIKPLQLYKIIFYTFYV